MLEIQDLKDALKLSILKKNHNIRVSSIAYSLSGHKYKAGLVESDTNLLNIAPEQIVLAFSVQNNDFKVNKVVTLFEKHKTGELVSPITGKILIDHSIRTGIDIEYIVIDFNGDIIFKIDNVKNLFGNVYNPENQILSKTLKTEVSENKIELLKGYNIEDALRKYSVKGIERNFPTYDSASGYGSAVLTKDGIVYFAGQYSGFEKRLGLHSEVAVILRALMDKGNTITHIGLASSKYLNEPCNMCGSCRQFLSEMTSKFNFDLEINLFAKESDAKNKTKISDYLPNQWTSKNW